MSRLAQAGRQQHRVARARLRGGPADGGRQVVAALPRRRRWRRSAASIAAASRPISATRARVARHRRGERREVLPLAVAAEDQHQPAAGGAVGAQAVERGDGGADVGALAVVVEVDAVDAGDEGDAVRLAAVLAQAVQHRRERAADGVGQRQRGERVGGVVAAAHAQRLGGHQALQRGAPRRRRRRAGAAPPRPPARAPARPCRGRRRGRSRRHGAARRGRSARPARGAGFAARRAARRDATGSAGAARRLDRRVVAVDDHHRPRAPDARLGGGVGVEAAVPVEVVLRDVEQRRRVGSKPCASCSWKLDSSSTQTSGSAPPASSAAASVPSRVGPMLPATATLRPARSTSCAVIAVVVVLPLVPVMASTRGA